jgi:hypothetical protein
LTFAMASGTPEIHSLTQTPGAGISPEQKGQYARGALLMIICMGYDVSSSIF